MVQISRRADGPGWTLTSEQWLPRTREELFAFFADAFQLEDITPPWLHFHVVAEAPIAIRQGTLIDYRLKLHGIPLRWRSEITLWEPPQRFVDEQRKGPYSSWRHEHVLIEKDGGTLCRDRVDYAVPGGWLVNRLFVEPDVRRIFEYRLKRLNEIFSEPPASEAPL